MNTALIISDRVDPWYNLSVEEYLLRNVAEDQMILYLWQNQHTVVIGKHQNAWKECDCRLLESEGGKLARRLSGGGAVYHDLGNLNFTFCMGRDLYDQKRQLQVILDAVRSLGVAASFTGRNDLTVNGKKFSGNAFCFKSKGAYHHGTILVSSSLDSLERYLHPSMEKIISKGVDMVSVRSRVVNLADLNPDITIEGVKRAVMASFIAEYGDISEQLKIDSANREIAELYRKNSSWEWRYGQAPEFDVIQQKRFAWGELEICLGVEDGQIRNAVVYSDAMDCELVEELENALQGVPFRKSALLAGVSALAASGEWVSQVDDIKGWLEDWPLGD